MHAVWYGLHDVHKILKHTHCLVTVRILDTISENIYPTDGIFKSM